MADKKNTEEIVLRAAEKVFKQKGFDGATVQDIADEAGITKSMVNYYFRTKEKLFVGIFHKEFKQMMSAVASIAGSDMPLREQIQRIVEVDIEKISQVPDMPLFVVTEIHRNPEIVFKNFGNMPIQQILQHLDGQIAAEVAKGTIRPIKARDLLINIQSLTIFPFLARPMMCKLMGLTDEMFNEMMQARKHDIVNIIWDSIKA